MGHEAIICKDKRQHYDEEAKTTYQEKEDNLFVTTCFTNNEFNKLLAH